MKTFIDPLKLNEMIKRLAELDSFALSNHVLETIKLQFVDSEKNANKYYHLACYSDGVVAIYGRLAGSSKPPYKRTEQEYDYRKKNGRMSVQNSKTLFRKLIKEKLGKGYKEI